MILTRNMIRCSPFYLFSLFVHCILSFSSAFLRLHARRTTDGRTGGRIFYDTRIERGYLHEIFNLINMKTIRDNWFFEWIKIFGWFWKNQRINTIKKWWRRLSENKFHMKPWDGQAIWPMRSLHSTIACLKCYAGRSIDVSISCSHLARPSHVHLRAQLSKLSCLAFSYDWNTCVFH